MRVIFFAIFLFAGILQAQAQAKVINKYWVEFTDKSASPYSIHRPYEFLSARALQRRDVQGIAITEEDLPVSPTYIHAIKELGAKIYNRSKWFNAVTISIDEALLDSIRRLEFVERVEYVGKYKVRNRKKPKVSSTPKPFEYEGVDNPYGYAFEQIAINNGHILHALGYDGTGMLVAVLDGGFTKANTLPVFDSLIREGRLLGGPDFVEGDDYNFEGSHHGTQVLSVMSASLPGMMIGTAPGATYITIKTEDTKGEYRAEECSWVAGVEYADSIGADVVNSSLGYTTFNDSSMNYSYLDLDGRKSRASIAADKAFQRGLIVVNSAGNSGDSKWKYIGAPADAEYALSVAAVTRSRGRAGFSSYGPRPDGKIKPDVAALGQAVVVTSVNTGNVMLSNGTSFASPVIAGLVACLRQAFPTVAHSELVEVIKESGSQHYAPDESLGFGLPDFFSAYITLAEQKDIRVAATDPTITDSQDEILPGTLFFNMISQKIYLGTDDLPRGQYLTIYPDGSYGPIREVATSRFRTVQP